jgi:hypothetical protein
MPDDRAPHPQKSPRRWLAVVGLLAALGGGVFVAAGQRHPQQWPGPARTETTMGDSTCLSCHSEKASFEGTAHRLTTRLPASQTILGSFASGHNLLRTPNPALHFHMDADSAGFYETAVYGAAPDTTSRTERIAYVAGSGRKGQSFLYWKGDQLYQMPISYWKSLDSWINSPGPAYVEGSANFDRAVAPRCLECHATWMEPKFDPSMVTRFNAKGAVLGITCERCHAAGREHVEHERSVLHAVRSVRIVNPARLSRARKIDACAQCHGGLGQPILPSFTYVAGLPLEKFISLPAPREDATVDVHGNQVALLSRSRCFRSSEMTCITCHDVHRPQRNVAELSGRCLTCHQEKSCGLFPKEGHALAGRCVNCHMPLQTSNTLVTTLNGVKEQVQVRTHWIKVYPDSARGGR